MKRQRQRTRTSLGSQSQQGPIPTDSASGQIRAGEEQSNQDDMETDGIQAMVTDVKTHGVRFRFFLGVLWPTRLIYQFLGETSSQIRQEFIRIEVYHLM